MWRKKKVCLGIGGSTLVKVLALPLSAEAGVLKATRARGCFSHCTWSLLSWLLSSWDLLFPDPIRVPCLSRCVQHLSHRHGRLNSGPLAITARTLAHPGISSALFLFFHAINSIFCVFETVAHYRYKRFTYCVALSKNWRKKWIKSHVKVFPVQIIHLSKFFNWLRETGCIVNRYTLIFWIP